LPSDQPPEKPIPAEVARVRASDVPAGAPSFARWSILNPYWARHARSLSLGIVGFRRLSERHENLGYSLAFGESLTTVRGPFLAGARQEHELRFVPHDSLSLGLWRYQWEAGPRIGPLEPMVRVGFTVANLGWGNGLQFGMFSPRVGAGLWLKLGKSRIGLNVFTEYSWRWVGREDAYVHGLVLEVNPDAPPLVKPWPRPTSSPSAPANR
jgi:hypothetical protein